MPECWLWPSSWDKKNDANGTSTTIPWQQQQRPFNSPLSGTTRISRYQKGKTNLDLLEQESVSGSGIGWAICKYASRPRQITTLASHRSVLQAGCPSRHPTNSIKALKANIYSGLSTTMAIWCYDCWNRYDFSFWGNILSENISSKTEIISIRVSWKTITTIIILRPFVCDYPNQVTRYASQHIWCLSQARINWAVV